MVTATIEVGGETIARTIGPAELSLGALEDLERLGETKKTSDLVTAMAGFLGITRAQAREIKQGQFKEIMDAIQGANDVSPTTG